MKGSQKKPGCKAVKQLSANQLGFNYREDQNAVKVTQQRWIIQQMYCRSRHYSEIDPKEHIMPLIDSLRRFVQEWKNTKVNDFWHRKSKKVVLAVLQVYNPDTNDYEYFRGFFHRKKLLFISYYSSRINISRVTVYYIKIFIPTVASFLAALNNIYVYYFYITNIYYRRPPIFPLYALYSYVC
eukprot:GHVR01170862.1.p1 GENE.GHVR01170862.1~~GHVR01170862.1.p1  ORF type:complete len:183 (+),score=3.62 GHVR01170862.1:114-662(+)